MFQGLLERAVSKSRKWTSENHARPKIAIGVADWDRFIDVVDLFSSISRPGIAEIVAFTGTEVTGSSELENVAHVAAEKPEAAMVSALNRGDVDATVRGELSSSSFLSELKHQAGVSAPRRIALLSDVMEREFFFAPVGIDEGNTANHKLQLVLDGVALMKRLGVVPRVSVLSGGRIDDAGRGEEIKRTIDDAIGTVRRCKEIDPNMEIVHGQILVEDALPAGFNFLLAPGGMAGNLMYRTLLHLGGGTSRGAFLVHENLIRPVIDTSRVGPVMEHASALVLALASVVEKNDT